VHLDHLLLLVTKRDGGQVAGQIDIDDLGEDAGGAVHEAEFPPVGRLPTRFFLQFAPGGLGGRFPVVDLAGGQFPEPAARGVAILPQETDLVRLIQGYDGGPSRVMNDLQLGLMTVG
jgi:hypothetical protein